MVAASHLWLKNGRSVKYFGNVNDELGVRVDYSHEKICLSHKASFSSTNQLNLSQYWFAGVKK